jgi:hypothetical protein
MEKTTTVRYVHELPPHFHNSMLYLTIQQEYPGQNIKLDHPRPLKLDKVFKTFEDVLLILDTCEYLGAEIPWEVLDFAYSRPERFLFDMEVFEYKVHKKIQEYGFFMKTPEYHAIKQCFMFSYSDQAMSLNGFVSYSIKHDSLIMVRYYEHKCKYLFPVEISTLLTTIQYGRFEILKYFAKKPWFSEKTADISNQKKLCSWSAVFGHVEILRFLREQLRFEWDTNVIDEALINRRFSCLKYGLENSAPITTWAIGTAIQRCPVEYIQLLVKFGFSIIDDIYTLYACQRGDLGILIYLHNKGVPWHPNAINVAARLRHKDCVHFGVECGASYNAELVLKYIFPEEWKKQVVYTSTSDSDDESWIL